MELNINSGKTSFGIARRSQIDLYFDFKTKIHDRLLDLIELSRIEKLDRTELKSQIRTIVGRILAEDPEGIPLNSIEREKLFKEIQDEVLGLGPLEPFL